MAWGMRMNKLAMMVKSSVTSFYGKMAGAVGIWTFIWFLLLIIIFSPLEYYDATDGIRHASAFVVAMLVGLASLFYCLLCTSESIPRTARQAVGAVEGLGASLRTAFSWSVKAAYWRDVSP